ncbi:ABC transporter ATP-binding protein [Tepiditoga spiralis]|uniref:ABC transporter ATP-binding protein n=1 Tax=Tepiditoga spiralis TaxID=2108365 RepID=A0A7G1G886_9BACT|nr:ABC transporter ATP-binding protein [Tepiditoga spiralis]BBE31157.1 ABC transporter ATP-binding protein [Tepiditoga spiralis]
MKTKNKILEIKDLYVNYGAIKAIKGIDINVNKGEIVTLIGANGAGKTTTLDTIVSLVKAKSGVIKLGEEEITNVPSDKIIQKGIALSPEGRRIFSNLTVYENLLMGAYTRTDQEEIKKDFEWVYSLFPRLKERRKQKGGTLSGGEQQMLAIARALMSRPKILMLDEPSLGLAPLLVKEVFEIIKKINSEGTTVLLVEQNAKAALDVADYAYVLETGIITMEGPANEIANNPDVRAAYLGG